MKLPCNSSTLAAVALAIAIPLGTFVTTAGIMMIPPDTKGMSLSEGRDLFRAHCGSCHFATAGFPAHHGPNLHDIGRLGARRKPGMSAPAYILESVLDPGAFVAPSSRPGMPSNVAAKLPPDKLRNIVAFLASCGAFPDFEEIASLEIPDRRPKEKSTLQVHRIAMEQAVSVMESKASCLTCHSRNTTPDSSIQAPNIFHVGLADRDIVRTSIVDPNREVKANYGTVNVTLVSGEVVTGRLLTQDAERLLVSVWTPEGKLAVREIRLADIDTEDDQLLIDKSPRSIMPSDFDKLLSAEELESVLTLIQQLN